MSLDVQYFDVYFSKISFVNTFGPQNLIFKASKEQFRWVFWKDNICFVEIVWRHQCKHDCDTFIWNLNMK